jgi:hypothetical protein
VDGVVAEAPEEAGEGLVRVIGAPALDERDQVGLGRYASGILVGSTMAGPKVKLPATFAGSLPAGANSGSGWEPEACT